MDPVHNSFNQGQANPVDKKKTACGDDSGEGQASNTFPLDNSFDINFCEDRGNSAQTSTFLETLNLKSKEDLSNHHLSNIEGSDIDRASHAYEQVNVDNFIDSSTGIGTTAYDAAPRQEAIEDSRYPNFLMNDPRQSENNFKFESDTYNESENQNSLGKTLATSLHLIAASDSHSVASPLPDSVGIELPLSTVEQAGPNSNDPVTSTTPESVSTPLPSRYRTRSISVSDKNASFKEESLISDCNKDTKEERISSTEDEYFYRCDQCGKVFHKKQTLKQHFITHTDRFACAFCDVRCKSKGDLRSHTQTHTKEKPFHCEVCNTYYTRESILKKHKTTQLHKSACMKSEKKQMFSKKVKKLKCSTQVKKKRLICDQCFKACSTKKELQKHSRIHGFIYPCSKCERKCKTALHLKIHMKCHYKQNGLSCRLCYRSFPTAAMLKDHMRNHYRQNDKYPKKNLANFKCKDIKPDLQVFHSEAEKKPNSKRSKKEKEILFCQACPRRFKSPKAFERHRAKHLMSSDQTMKTESKPLDILEIQSNEKENDCCEDVKDNIECPEVLSTTEKQNTPQADVKITQSLICQMCYSVFSDSCEYKIHVQNHTPTMLFSGESLEGSKTNGMSKKFSKRCANSRTNVNDATDRESKVSTNFTKVLNDTKPQIKPDSGSENILDCFDFIKLLQNLTEESSDEGAVNDEDEDDESSDELYQGLRNLFCINKGDDSHIENYSVKTFHHKDKSSIECQLLLNSNTIQDTENHIYKCLLCNISFSEYDQLNDHIKSHARDVGNNCYGEKKTLLQHKFSDDTICQKEKVDIAEIPDDDSSMSESEANDLFLDELESVLDCEMKSNTQVDFLHTFSHEEIVKANKKIFERHSCIDVPTNIYACTICKRKYARPTTLTRHFKTHVCHYCNKFFVDKSDLLDHKYKHRQKAALLKAEISGEQSTKILNSPLLSKANRELFKKYTFIDSGRNINKCCLCDKTFVRKTVLTRHMKTHICSYCDKFYEDKYELARHISMHKIEAQVSEDGGEVRDYNDFDDEKPFSSRSTLTNPLETDSKVVTLDPTFPSSLPHFSSTFANPGGDGHETLTFIEIPVSDNCDNTNNVNFGNGNEAATSTYQIISDSINAYKESAHESFIVDGSECQPDDHSKMITIAQGQIMEAEENRDRLNLFECTLCGKTFFKSGHLKSHMSTHSVRKSHVCHLCGKSFVRRGALKRHEKSHDIKRCKFCETTFNFQFELDDHMQMHDSYSFYK